MINVPCIHVCKKREEGGGEAKTTELANIALKIEHHVAAATAIIAEPRGRDGWKEALRHLKGEKGKLHVRVRHICMCKLP